MIIYDFSSQPLSLSRFNQMRQSGLNTGDS